MLLIESIRQDIDEYLARCKDDDFSDDGEAWEMCKRIRQWIDDENAKPKLPIIVAIEGGLLTDVLVPEGSERPIVRIDYDTEGADDEDIQTFQGKDGKTEAFIAVMEPDTIYTTKDDTDGIRAAQHVMGKGAWS